MIFTLLSKFHLLGTCHFQLRTESLITPRAGDNGENPPEQEDTTQNNIPGGGMTASPSSSDPSSSLQHYASGNGKGKQKRKSSGDDDDDDDDDRGRHPKKQRNFLSPPNAADDRNKFSCPYRKRNPRKYASGNKQWRSCALTPQENIARVK